MTVKSISVLGANADELRLFNAISGIGISEQAELKVRISREDSRRTRYIEKASRLSDEKFILDVKSDTEVEVLCFETKSLIYALLEIVQRYKNATLKNGIIEGYPLFKTRGYIEGFYGKPWTADERLYILKIMAKKRMNTVYYAPKDDAYHREKWRELYNDIELERLRQLASYTHEYCMDFHYCIAPGLSIKYTDEADFKYLNAKTQQLYSIGIKKFGLLLDDIAEDLIFDEDKQRFGELVNAHIDLINRYYSYLKSLDTDICLTVCPTLYNGRGDEYYISKLGQGIPADVSVFWTGRDICSRDITSLEAIKFTENTMHKPLYWDNYPVNDCAMYNEMHLSAIINRDNDLYRYSEGIIANCMEYAHCSAVALMSIADYLWDSENYDSEASFESAVQEVVGEQYADAFMTFADHLYTSCLKDENSRRLQAVFLQHSPEVTADYFKRMTACCEYLKQDLPLCRELNKWKRKFFALYDIFAAVIENRYEDIEKLVDIYEAFPARLCELNIKQELRGLL